MPELQDILSSGALIDMELDGTYTPTQDKDVMTKIETEALTDQLDTKIDNLTVDGGTY